MKPSFAIDRFVEVALLKLNIIIIISEFSGNFGILRIINIKLK